MDKTIKGITVNRGTIKKIINEICASKDLLAIWNLYKGKYPYAEEIEFSTILSDLRKVMDRE
ncbi:MAG: hypothetical protein COA82_08175 [Alkaliphilus sp.]|nr:MAG: hypothetical protein COA82_08175 [Alkaliphilus sp.]